MNKYKINGVVITEKFLNEYREVVVDGRLPALHGRPDGRAREIISILNNYLVDNEHAIAAYGNQRGKLKEGVDLDNVFRALVYNEPTRVDIVKKDLERVSLEPKKRKKKDRMGYVYFIKAPNGKVKIGKTINLHERFYAIEAMSPVDLELIFAIECGRNLTKFEGYFHRLFARKRSHGEWFDLSDQDLELVRSWCELRRSEVVSIIPIPDGLKEPKNKALIKITQFTGFVLGNYVLLKLIAFYVAWRL